MSEMSDFERSLARLTPKADLNRDQLLFRAGARSAERSHRFVVPSLMLGLGLALGAASVWNLREPERIAVAVAPQAPAEEPPVRMESYSYVVLQQRYLDGDFSGPAASEPTHSPRTQAESLAEQRAKMLQSDSVP